MKNQTRIIIEKIRRERSEGISSQSSINSLSSEECKEDITKETSFLDPFYDTVKFSQRVWHVINDNYEAQICICGGPKLFFKNPKGYHATCGSAECKILQKTSKFKETCQEKWGSDHHMKTDEGKKSLRDSMVSKYGVTHNWKGALREASHITMEKKYGARHALQNKEISLKRNATALEKHGTLNFIESDKSKSTMIEKYGAVNPMKVKSIVEDVTKKSRETKLRKLEGKLLSHRITLKDFFYPHCSFLCEKCCNIQIGHMVTVNRKIRIGIDPCTICNPVSIDSLSENEVFEFISSIYSGKIERNVKFEGKFEIDIYLPEIGTGIEFNGVYWHSELYKEKEYHKNKTGFFLDRNIEIYHIWEDDWASKKDLIKSKISGILKERKKIPARKTTLDNIGYKEAFLFLEANHLQGGIASSFYYGLKKDGELLAVMTISPSRAYLNKNPRPGEFEIIRYASLPGISIIGGISKILSHFIKEHKPSFIVSFCETDFSPNSFKTGYYKIGMALEKWTDPNYFYVVDGIRTGRGQWTKKKLIKMGYDPSLSESEIMASMGAYKIHNSGNYKFILEVKNENKNI